MHAHIIDTPIRKSLAIVVITVLFTAMIGSIQGANASTQTEIPAIADAYVDNAQPSVNYGNSLFLYTHYYFESVGQAGAGSGTENEVGPIVHTWLKFDLSQIPKQATIRSVTLRMHTAMWGTRSNNKVGVFVCEDDFWIESGLSWNDAPAASVNSNPVVTLECADPDLDYNFELSSTWNGKRSISLVLKTLEFSKEPAVFNSINLNPKSGPTLIVEYDMPVDIGLIGAVVVGIALAGTILAVFAVRSKKKSDRRS